jgi:protein TonB
MKIILTSLLLLIFCAAHSQTDSAVYFNPEIQAMYPGGIQAWYLFLERNLTYPGNAVSYNVQGQVVTRFILDSTGKAHDFTIVSGPEQLQDECIRVLKKVGIWSPAIQGGKKVNAWKTQPINFKLESR